jgi:hypothetical protein
MLHHTSTRNNIINIPWTIGKVSFCIEKNINLTFLKKTVNVRRKKKFFAFFFEALYNSLLVRVFLCVSSFFAILFLVLFQNFEIYSFAHRWPSSIVD